MRRSLLGLCAFGLLFGCKREVEQPLRVAAAADLAHAFNELTPAFVRHTPSLELKLTSGATGLLARQIAQGAPFDVFLSANREYVDQVVRSGACDAARVQSYTRGRLAIWSKTIPRAELNLASLGEAHITHIAIANPEHAPYGKAARQALSYAGLWPRLATRLVFGENVQQTLQLAQSGNAEVAIIGLSLAIDSSGGVWSVVDDAAYEPLIQALTICKQGTNRAAAQRFVDFLSSAEGRTILRKFGFTLPGEAWAFLR